jgi:hypothetical protein
MCQEPCPKPLLCGHRCYNLCGQECYCPCEEFLVALDTEREVNLLETRPVSLAQTLMEAGAQESSLVHAHVAAASCPPTRNNTAPATATPPGPAADSPHQNAWCKNNQINQKRHSAKRENVQGLHPRNRNWPCQTKKGPRPREPRTPANLQVEAKPLTEKKIPRNPWVEFQRGLKANTQNQVNDLMTGDALSSEGTTHQTESDGYRATNSETGNGHTFQLTETYRPTGTTADGLRVVLGPSQRRQSSQLVPVTKATHMTTQVEAAENARLIEAFSGLKTSGAFKKYGNPLNNPSPPESSSASWTPEKVLTETWVEEYEGAGWVRGGINTSFVSIDKASVKRKKIPANLSQSNKKEGDTLIPGLSRTPPPTVPAPPVLSASKPPLMPKVSEIPPTLNTKIILAKRYPPLGF